MTYDNGDVISEAGKFIDLKMRKEAWQGKHGWLYLPANYFDTEKKYPLICFYHGARENTSMSKVLTQGLPAVIQSGNPPYAKDKDGNRVDFIIYAVSEAAMGAASTFTDLPNDFAFLLDYYKIRIDTNRVYATGLSAGGNATLGLLGLNRNIFAAGVPMSTVWNNLNAEQRAGLNGAWIWQLHGSSDTATQSSVDRARTSILEFNEQNKDTPAILTAYPGGHGGWERFYNPAYKENGLNIYDWMLQFSRTGAAQEPPVTDPAPRTITRVVVEYSDGTQKVME